MKNTFFNFCAFALLVLITQVTANAQNNKPAPSPSSKLTQMVGLTEITVEYSRPSVKGRTIFGKDGALQPYGTAWRTGANSANKFTFSTEVTVNGTKLPAGAYTMTTVPGEKEWKVNLYKYDGTNSGAYASKKADASFTVASKNLGSFSMESFLININNIKDASATIDLMWSNTLVAIPN